MGKNALIVGASGDIGIAIAKKLAKDGYQLLLHYNKNKQAITKLKKEIDQDCILSVSQANLSSEKEINQFIKQIAFPVHMIIFASGNAYYGLFQEMKEDTIKNMLTLHVKAPLLITKHLLPQMIQKRSGKIIFITSIWGSVGASYEVLYSTVKGAQNSFIKALAKEVAPSGISVNGISPGFIDTKMNNHLRKEERAAIVSDIPIQRSGTVDDIAHTVRFLCDEQTKYIQGEIIQVTGGWH